MTACTPIPRDLYRRAEADAGEIRLALTGRLKSRRPVEVLDPDWELHPRTGRASTVAVVSALCCGEHDVPEHAWPEVLRLYCPTAWRMPAEAGISFEQWNTGRCETVLSSRIGATANAELGGYAVFAAMDVPVVAEVVAVLGAIPTFT
ncbi:MULTISPECIES: hypothetical protein [Amycolatopsis]|uniref:Uncharacterized protein n=1 Tax=Amycolatopsis albidoflavus TaxID=102226 RepID=A0ABW5IE88_9PSEU